MKNHPILNKSPTAPYGVLGNFITGPTIFTGISHHLCSRQFQGPGWKEAISTLFPDFLSQKTRRMLSNKDNNSFNLGLKMYDVRNNSSTAIRRLFFSPQEMALYGRRVYGRGDMTFRNLSILYTRRTLTLVNRYGSAFFKQLLIRNRKKRESAGFGGDAAAFKSWMLQ